MAKMQDLRPLSGQFIPMSAPANLTTSASTLSFTVNHGPVTANHSSQIYVAQSTAQQDLSAAIDNKLYTLTGPTPTGDLNATLPRESSLGAGIRLWSYQTGMDGDVTSVQNSDWQVRATGKAEPITEIVTGVPAYLAGVLVPITPVISGNVFPYELTLGGDDPTDQLLFRVQMIDRAKPLYPEWIEEWYEEFPLGAKGPRVGFHAMPVLPRERTAVQIIAQRVDIDGNNVGSSKMTYFTVFSRFSRITLTRE